MIYVREGLGYSDSESLVSGIQGLRIGDERSATSGITKTTENSKTP